MRRPLVFGLLALFALPRLAAAQEPPDLLSWMGLEPGDTMAFATADGSRVCVTVGPARRIGDRAFAPLNGLWWPGFATDSRILVPLDGSLGLYVDPTPGPRPTAEPFLPAEGWSRPESDWIAADVLVFRSCDLCVDSGTTVVLERDGGIRSIERRSIVGPTTLTRLEGGCAERKGVRLELYVEPAPAGDP
jgi:hypothetical protein